MKKIFTLLIALVTLCSVAYSTGYNVKLYASDATPSGAIATNSQYVIGTGSWQNNQAVSKLELYLPITALGSFTIDDIASLQFSTQKEIEPPSNPNLDIYWTIYTNGTKYGWYQERFTSEPMYYNGYAAPNNVWTTFSTSGSVNQMTFYDGHYGPQGFYNAPTLADLQAGAINWNSWTPGGSITSIDYGAQTVKYISLGTGSSWNSVMRSYFDAVIITLKNGDKLTIDLDKNDPAPTTTILNPTSTVCGTYDFPVTVKDFKNVGNISLKLSYSSAVLAYQGVTLNPAISSAVPNGINPGQFILSYYGNGVYLNDDDVLFTLHFTLLPTASGVTTDLNWSTIPGECEYSSPGAEPIVYLASFVDKTWTIPVRPVKNTTTLKEYCKIQDAINDPATLNGHTITVAAGTYKEDININKEITLLGNNTGLNGCPGGHSNPESVIVPLTNNADPASPTSMPIIYVVSNNVTIDGFTIDGSSGDASPYVIEGVTVNSIEGIGAWDGVANLHISHNIIQNLTDRGVDIYNYGNGGAMTSGNQVYQNGFFNINPQGLYAGGGLGVLIYNNAYTDVTYNCMDKVRVGVQTGNYYRANAGGVNPMISYNDIKSFKIGVWHNLAYSAASTFTIDHNLLQTTLGSTVNNGIKIGSIQGTTAVDITNNSVTAAMAGINLWNNPTSATVTVAGSNTFTGCNYGVFANNYDGYTSNAASSVYILDGCSIVNPVLAGIYVKDNSANSNGATVSVTVQNNTTVSGITGAAILVEGGSASLNFSGAAPQASLSGTPKYIVLQTNSVDVPAANIDATQVQFGGSYGSAMSLPTLFATEDKIDHKIDLSTLGLVTFKANNDYVTTGSFVAPNTQPLVQRGIDAAGLTGWTVNVGPGTFDNSMEITKSLQVLGQGKTNTFLDRSANAAAGSIVYIHGSTGDVLVDGFTFKTGPASTKISNGVEISNLTSAGTITISNNEIWGVQSASKTAFDNFTLIAGYFTITTPKLVFTNNIVHGGSDNPLLLERWIGPTEITNNFIYQNPLKDFSASDVLFMMNYNVTNNAKQLISGNTFDMGWGTTNQRGVGVSIASSYPGGTTPGGFTNVEVSNNTFLNLKPNRRGISTYNNSSDGTGGDVVNALITGNTISNATGYSGEFGIRILGKATGTLISNNLISGVNDAVKIQPWNGHEAVTTTVNNNSLLSTTGYGINNLASTTVDGTCNWFGSTVPAAVGSKINGPVNYIPWLSSGIDADLVANGFQPSVPCAPCAISLGETHTDVVCPLVATGSITLTVSGAVTPYTCYWSGPGGYHSALQSPTGLGIGNYSVLVTGDNGCSATLSVTIVLTNEPAPVITPASGASTVECLTAAVMPTPPAGTDHCGTPITPVLYSTVDSPATITCEGSRTYTFTYTDYQPKTTNWVYTYTIDHTIAPVIPANGGSKVECIASATLPTPPSGIVDVCGNAVPAVLASTVDVPSSLTCEGTRTYSFTYTDCSNLVSTWKYVYVIDHTKLPVEVGGPALSASTVECPADAIAPTTLPVVQDICGTTLLPGAPTKHLNTILNFNTAVTTGATPAPGVWYTDRYAPAGFTSPVVFGGDNRLMHSINAADYQGNTFYKTQGRGYDVGAATNEMEIKLFIPSDWATTNRRMAGFWGVAVDATNSVSGYPIVEFASDGGVPRFQAWEDGGAGSWVSMGLPAGFTYNTWVTLKIRLLPSGQFLVSAGSLNYVTTTFTPGASVRLKSTILQGYNYDPVNNAGVTYDIYWDDFTYNDTYSNICEGTITYTYDYADCSGLPYSWVYTYTIDRTTVPAEVGVHVPVASTVECATSAVAPALPVIKDVCGNTLTPLAGSPVMGGTYTDCEGTISYTYNYKDCADLPFAWTYTYTIDHTIAPVIPANGGSTVECIASATLPTPPSGIVDVCGNAVPAVLASTVDVPSSLTCEGTRTYSFT
ncbi:MAG: hypothetical protein HXX13_18135, partial [Bacteroidetes bacterium]|nr:hypothetical protein [Bacteroidota bacterium]